MYKRIYLQSLIPSLKLGLRLCLQKLHPESELTVYEAETRPESKTRSGPMPESEIWPEIVSETQPETVSET